MQERARTQTRRLLLRTLATVLAALLGVLGLSPAPAHAAAVITPTNVSFTMDPHEFVVGWSGPVTINFNFCTPNDAQAGDYFTLTLPTPFSNWPDGFDVTLGGAAVTYHVTIDDSSLPAVATFTLTADGAAVDNLCARTQFGGALSSSVEVGTYEATYQLNSEPLVVLDTPITVNPVPDSVFDPPSSSWKSSWFEDQSNQCRTSTEACIVFQFVVKAGPGTKVVVDDKAGANWEWACGWMNNQFGTGAGWQDFYLTTYDGNGHRTVVSARDDPKVLALISSYSCTAGLLHVEFDTSSLTDLQSLELYFHASALEASGAGGVKYANTGELTLTEPTQLSTQTESTWVGGISEGDYISILKNDVKGRKGDTEATAVSLPSGTTELAIQVRNTGTTDLKKIVVSDTVVTGSGTVRDLSCDFSPYGGPATGTDGGDAVLPSGKAINCTATLTGVVDLHEDVASVTATGNGEVKAENPYWATGVMNLVLAKALVETGPFKAGQTVHYTLTPSNDGTATALAGWSVTDLLPAGLTPVSIGATDPATTQYTCTLGTLSCKSSAPLAAGATAPAITVEATIDAGFAGKAHNVAYVAPAEGDTETNPLVVPKTDTDTDTTHTDNDAQADLTIFAVSVGDYVWLDANRDGLQSPGEVPIADVTVKIFKGTDTSVAPLDTTATGADGYYSFTGLDPATQYTIVFVAPTGNTFTTANASGVTSNDPMADNGSTALDGTTGGDSDAVPAADGLTGAVTFTSPASGANKASSVVDATVADNPGLDAGFVTQINLTLAKSLDTAGPFVPGQNVTFTLTPHNDGPMAALPKWSVTDILPAGLSLVSMSGAGYDCSGLICTAQEGLAANSDGPTITVVAKLDASFTGSAKNVAYVAPATGDVTETVPLIVPTTDTDTTKPDTDNDAEASLTVAKVSIGDYVWWDNNRDGLQTDGEPVVAGMTVNLLDGAGTVIRTATTDANGYYSFTGLLPNATYTVEFVKSSTTDTATAAFTTRDASGDSSNSPTADLSDSDASPVDGKVMVTTPASGNNLGEPGKADNPGIDAGLVKFNLKLAKSLDTAGPFSPGQTVSFTLAPHNDGPSAALAGWSVTEVLPAELTLVSITGAGYDCTGLTCVAKTALAPNSDGAPIMVTATINAAVFTPIKNVAYVAPAAGDVTETVPLGEIPTTATDTTTSVTDNDAEASLSMLPVSIGDFVWYDVNRDGLQTDGEAPYVGMTVNLYDAKGALVASDVTDGGGYYSFTNLFPNTEYTVEFVKQTSESFTTQNAGTDTTNSPTGDLTDSDANPTDGKVTLTTTVGGSNLGEPGKADNPGIDAGLVKFNLLLEKSLVTTAKPHPGDEVTFELIPSNEGPTDSLASWSVTEVLPAGLTLVSMAGVGYDCTTVVGTCTAAAPLAAGRVGSPVTVVARVDGDFVGSLRNVAYVAPNPTDVPETNPLEVPTTDTDTTTSTTDNDAEAPLTVTKVVLPQTGTDADLAWLGAAGALLVAGFALVLVGRRRR